MSCGSLDSFKNILGDAFKNLSASLKCMDNTTAAIAEQSSVAQDALTAATSAIDPSIFSMLVVPEIPGDSTAPAVPAPPSYDDMMSHIAGIGGSLAGFATQAVAQQASLVEQLKISIIAGQANSALDEAMAAQDMTPIEEPADSAVADTPPAEDPPASDVPVDPALGDYTEDPAAAMADNPLAEKFSDITKQTASICKTIGKGLQVRNENATELMRWTAFKGNPLIINFDNGQQIEIAYTYAAGHRPRSIVPWTDHSNATPIDDLRQQRMTADEAANQRPQQLPDDEGR